MKGRFFYTFGFFGGPFIEALLYRGNQNGAFYRKPNFKELKTPHKGVTKREGYGLTRSLHHIQVWKSHLHSRCHSAFLLSVQNVGDDEHNNEKDDRQGACLTELSVLDGAVDLDRDCSCVS